MEAVRQYGYALQYAAEELRADREVVLEAVRQCGDALQYAAEELRADREVVLEAVRQCGHALEHAAYELHADKEVVLEAVRTSGRSVLNWTPVEFLDDATYLFAQKNRIALQGFAAVVCTVNVLAKKEEKNKEPLIVYRATVGMSGREVSGELPYEPSLLMDLASNLSRAAGDSLIHLMLFDDETPVSPLLSLKPLKKYCKEEESV